MHTCYSISVEVRGQLSKLSFLLSPYGVQESNLSFFSLGSGLFYLQSNPAAKYYLYLNTHILHRSVEYPPSGWIIVLWNVHGLTSRIWANRLPKMGLPLPTIAPESPVYLSKLCPLKYNGHPFNAVCSDCQQFSLWDDKQCRVFSYCLIGLSLWSVMCPCSWSTLKTSHLLYIANSVSHFLFMFFLSSLSLKSLNEQVHFGSLPASLSVCLCLYLLHP